MIHDPFVLLSLGLPPTREKLVFEMLHVLGTTTHPRFTSQETSVQFANVGQTFLVLTHPRTGSQVSIVQESESPQKREMFLGVTTQPLIGSHITVLHWSVVQFCRAKTHTPATHVSLVHTSRSSQVIGLVTQVPFSQVVGLHGSGCGHENGAMTHVPFDAHVALKQPFSG